MVIGSPESGVPDLGRWGEDETPEAERLRLRKTQTRFPVISTKLNPALPITDRGLPINLNL
ncbi:hypothetical protein [Microcoleus sp. FACHB-831]|uniref:hypothetical protein n=1 Tax=Microcoleus sp. FACHB-831 TaxID=2692827 RepID=UPI0016831CD8|nr:hypothetical protein [Microcoleus sp. FACHB-831]